MGNVDRPHSADTDPDLTSALTNSLHAADGAAVGDIVGVGEDAWEVVTSEASTEDKGGNAERGEEEEEGWDEARKSA
jgi:hypothetical protein